jgi:phosphoribosylanthranilate isomerase
VPAFERTRIKFCGMTSPEDVGLAVEAGADAVGIIVTESPRSVSLERVAEIVRAIPPFVAGIGVVGEVRVGEIAPVLRDLGLTLQFSGPEPPDSCERLSGGRTYIKAFHVNPEGVIDTGLADFGLHDYPHALWMFDSSSPGLLGGTGIAFRWDFVEALARERPIVVAGGLTHENVGALIRLMHPYAVDARSGIERDGKKDPELMRKFVRAVREGDARP